MKKKYILELLTISAILFLPNSYFAQSVVINEIVAAPRQDWSLNDFATGTSPGGSSGTNDEWVELYIKTAGLDLTNWTIELLDGSDVIGNLTNTGAFDVSNYITSGLGTFTNTEVGDFLVLGNVDGSGGINNSITINLKDNLGNIIDSVTLGGGAGQAPSGGSSTVGNESVFRMPNGTDTDANDVDFSKGVASIGALNPTQVSWSGVTNTDWATTTNWAMGSLPISTDNIIIANNIANYPIINRSTNTEINNLIVQNSASLTIDGGSLIVNGTSTGNVTYNRTIDFVAGNTNGWYLMASPVSGQVYNNTYATANDLASSSTRRGLATYTTALNSWSYLENNDSNAGTFLAGTGYSIKRGSTGNVSFTGTINTSDVSVTVANTGTGFNLLGNPFTASLNTEAFLIGNSANLDSQTIWVFDQATGNYETHVSVTSFILAPTQGFFVKAKNNNVNLTFAERNQATSGGTFQKTSKTEVKLLMNDGSNNRFARIYYLDNATTGFDNGFDGETFGGIANSVDVFTHLVANSEGKKFQVQSLPNSDFENTVVPVGVKAAAGKEITFSVEAMNIPDGINVYLEDKATNTVTLLSEANATYKVTLSESLDGIGRFYLHTKASGVLGTETVDFENVSVYAINNNTLRVVGIPSGNSSIKLFNILGKQVMQTSFSSTGVQDISLPKLATGMYIIQLESAAGKLNKKIVLE